MTRRVLLLANPVAGRGRAAAAVGDIAAALRQRNLAVETAATPPLAEAGRLTEAVSGPWDAIVALGGDGTLSRVAGAVFASAQGRPAAELPALGFLPYGTANVAVRAFGLPRGLKATLDAVAAGGTREVDVGLVTRKEHPAGFFLLWLGAGLDGALIHAVANARVGPLDLGIFHYVVPAFRTFGRYAFPPITVEVDGEPVPPSASVMIANVGPLAVGNIAPGADPSDGRMDVVSSAPRSRLFWFGAPFALAVGRYEQQPGVCRRAGVKMKLTAEGEVPVHMDGEAAGTLPLEVEVRPRAVRLLMPTIPT